MVHGRDKIHGHNIVTLLCLFVGKENLLDIIMYIKLRILSGDAFYKNRREEMSTPLTPRVLNLLNG